MKCIIINIHNYIFEQYKTNIKNIYLYKEKNNINKAKILNFTYYFRNLYFDNWNSFLLCIEINKSVYLLYIAILIINMKYYIIRINIL